MLSICGIKKSQMPQLFESYEVVGTIKQNIAQKLGIPKNVKIAAGAGDNAAAAIGTATVGEGSCNISLGTSGTIFISSETFKADNANALHAFAHADGKFHLMGCMLSAASCNKWWMEDILKTEEYAQEQKDISDNKLGENHIYYLPYLMGERAPHNDTNAKSCFIGLSMNSTREDMTQAVLEGVAFGIRDSLEAVKQLGIQINSSMICGGGAKSPLWKKILANVLNIELITPETEQGPAYGGAILAAVACEEYASVNDAVKKLVSITEKVAPDKKIAERYERRYQTFRKLYPTLKSIFTEI